MLRISTMVVMMTIVVSLVFAQTPQNTNPVPDWKTTRSKRVSQAEREAAAARAREARAAAKQNRQSLMVSNPSSAMGMPMPGPGETPHYFGPEPNWAFSPPIRKFVDSLPGLTVDGMNNLGQYIPVANPDTITYPGSDYYEISIRQYKEKMHSDLPKTTLRGYVQTNKGTDGTGQNTIEPSPIHYLGPVIMARKDRPVRIKFTNELPTGEAGNLFIPVDTTVMGAGMGPLEDPDMPGMMANYTQNRATLHLHGGHTPWISDGTPHQWITPAGEDTPYPKGVSVSNVPDMPDPGDGSQTFFYTNQQSARLLFYHDHSYGITRLNVYAGEAAGYVITDPVEEQLLADNLVPDTQIPLIIQDKTFVDADTIMSTDPTWRWGSMPGMPMTGDLWLPHVYVPAQNPYDIAGVNATGRWHYGPWFWPPTNVLYGPQPNPYYDPENNPAEPPEIPGVPHPSMGMEAFFDTSLVNGTAFPTLTVKPQSYRFRILNAANDRFWNLQMYKADPDVIASDGRTLTEVKMVPAISNPNYPELWPTDNREGGVPDPATVGPSWIQIGTEGGFLPMPVVIPNQPVDWNTDPTTFNAGNVSSHSLLLGPAERADVIVDFSAFAGETLILYNDAPAAFPALDPRVDYYTDAPDLTETGGHSGPKAGFGPNTRTIMQIVVEDVEPAPAFDLPSLETAFASTDDAPGVFERSQDPIIVSQAAYNTAYDENFSDRWPYWGLVRIQDNSLTFKTISGDILTLPLQPKAIQDEMGEVFDLEYGRMSGKLGLELPFTNAGNQNFVLQNFTDKPTEILTDSLTAATPFLGDGTQIWKITHNGVDTHPIHFHLFDVQLLNRVGWDGAIRLPDANELGWKDTVRVSPLEDTIVALRPVSPKQPFGVPESIRPLNPSMPLGSTEGFTNINPTTGQPITPPITNEMFNFGWEYVWHCHILSHEEMDMMRPMSFFVTTEVPAAPSNLAVSNTGVLTWTDSTPADTSWGNLANEIGFHIERAENGGEFVALSPALANAATFTDTSIDPDHWYSYRLYAYNAAGSSLMSNVATLAIPPSKPIIGTAVAGNASVKVNFNPPASDGGSAITLYTVTSNPEGITATGVASPITVTGLTNGTLYSFTVTAENGVGKGPASDPSNSVRPATLSSVALTGNPTSPIKLGTTVALTATPPIGVVAEYQFWVREPGSAAKTLLRDYDTSNTLNWKPSALGTYNLLVYARNIGSKLAYQVYSTLAYQVNLPVSGVSLAGEPASPTATGMTAKLTATPINGAQPQYQFWIREPGSAAKRMLRDYDAANTLLWTPTLVGTNTLVVYVREKGSGAPYQYYDVITYIVKTPLTAVNLKGNPASPVNAGFDVTLTANPTGGGTPEYQFWVRTPGSAAKTLLRDYDTANTTVWTPGIAGTHILLVYAREGGSKAAYQVYQTISYTVN